MPPRTITDDAMAVLQTAEWPGDVRQLRNTIEWMLIMAPGDADTPIGVDGLPPDLANSAAGSMDPSANAALVLMPLCEARELFERDRVVLVVEIGDDEADDAAGAVAERDLGDGNPEGFALVVESLLLGDEHGLAGFEEFFFPQSVLLGLAGWQKIKVGFAEELVRILVKLGIGLEKPPLAVLDVDLVGEVVDEGAQEVAFVFNDTAEFP